MLVSSGFSGFEPELIRREPEFMKSMVADFGVRDGLRCGDSCSVGLEILKRRFGDLRKPLSGVGGIDSVRFGGLRKDFLLFENDMIFA